MPICLWSRRLGHLNEMPSGIQRTVRLLLIPSLARETQGCIRCGISILDRGKVRGLNKKIFIRATHPCACLIGSTGQKKSLGCFQVQGTD